MMSRIEEQIRDAIRRNDERAFARAVYQYDVALTDLRQQFYSADPGDDFQARMQQRALSSLLEAWYDGQQLEGSVSDIWRNPAKLLALQSSVRHAVVAEQYLVPWEMGRRMVTVAS